MAKVQKRIKADDKIRSKYKMASVLEFEATGKYVCYT